MNNAVSFLSSGASPHLSSIRAVESGAGAGEVAQDSNLASSDEELDTHRSPDKLSPTGYGTAGGGGLGGSYTSLPNSAELAAGGRGGGGSRQYHQYPPGNSLIGNSLDSASAGPPSRSIYQSSPDLHFSRREVRPHSGQWSQSGRTLPSTPDALTREGPPSLPRGPPSGGAYHSAVDLHSQYRPSSNRNRLEGASILATPNTPLLPKSQTPPPPPATQTTSTPSAGAAVPPPAGQAVDATGLLSVRSAIGVYQQEEPPAAAAATVTMAEGEVTVAQGSFERVMRRPTTEADDVDASLLQPQAGQE